jgi:2-polyprenyl-3-methyl-5-hydroxy-6-metoxy-1,4-benzoquinol methylase
MVDKNNKKPTQDQVKAYYDKCAKEWDIEGVSPDRIALNDEMIGDSFNRIATIMDIGCAGGGLSRYYVSQGYQVYGIDLSEKMIEFAKNHKSDTDREVYKCGDILKLSGLFNRAFNLVMACGTIEHFDAHDYDIMRKLCNISNRYIFVDFPTPEYRREHEHLSQIIDREVSIKDVRSGIHDAGFRIVRDKYYAPTPEGINSMYAIFAEKIHD